MALKCDCGGHKCGVPCYDWCQIEVAKRAAKPQLLTGSKAVIKVNGKEIAVADNVSFTINPPPNPCLDIDDSILKFREEFQRAIDSCKESFRTPIIGHECEYQDCPDGPCGGKVELRYAMTAYHYSAEDRAAGKPDPNRRFWACQEHYESYAAFWKEQWDEYYSMVRC